MGNATAPIFVLCYARSGSTLLRYILDSHPQIVAPPELHLLLAARQLLWIFRHTAQAPATIDPDFDVDAYTTEETRNVLSGIMQDHASRAGKGLWAEKSVSSADHLDILERLYPDSRLLCLHRRADDVMASCAEAAQKRQGTFGFEPFVARTPANVIDGLADYWIDKTRRLLEARQRFPATSFVLHYEDLVSDPQQRLAALFGFLDLEWSGGMLDSVFSTPHVVGPGDSKILTTTSIHKSSIGHGKRLALGKLSPDRRQCLDDFHRRLGYPAAGSHG
jgi:hypothetical protein